MCMPHIITCKYSKLDHVALTDPLSHNCNSKLAPCWKHLFRSLDAAHGEIDVGVGGMAYPTGGDEEQEGTGSI